jgi:hypothetical protein
MKTLFSLGKVEKFSVDGLLNTNSAFIFAMGFEDRALAIPRVLIQAGYSGTIHGIRYINSSGRRNRVAEARRLFEGLMEIKYSAECAHEFETNLSRHCITKLTNVSEIVIDISAMSKFLILVSIIVFLRHKKRIRIVFTTAQDYGPSKAQYEKVVSESGSLMSTFAGQPTSGVASILRSECLISSRMQGQPVCVVAFTSFNEELIRHVIGTLNPHRLILINGIPPEIRLSWRASATQVIHKKLLEEYSEDNQVVNSTGLLRRSVSTLDYLETLNLLFEIRREFGTYERIQYFSTGSKMQSVALSLLRAMHSDVHIESPTPASYFFSDYSQGCGDAWMVDIAVN